MPQIKFDKKQLDAMLAEVGGELTAMLKAEQVALAKSAVDDAPAEESEGSDGPSAPEGPPAEESGPPAEASSPPPGEASAPDGGEPMAPPEASAPAAPGQEQAIEPAPTPEMLQAEYSKLDPESLKMHYLACKSALMATMGADPGAAAGAPPAPEASAPGAGAPPPGAAPAGPPPGAAPMAMAAKKPNGPTKEENNEWEGMKTQALLDSKKQTAALGKSEARVAELETKMAKQEESLLKLVEVIATPIRKSVKGLSDLKYVERSTEDKVSPAANLTKKEIQTALAEKIREGKLSKSDKDLIMQFSVGSVDVSKIEHLLASAK